MRTTDVAVIGAGPAGIGAALAAARNGAGVVLIDEQPAPGGHLRWTLTRQTGFGDPLDGSRGIEIASWAAEALAAAGVQVLTNTIAWGLFEDNVIGVTSDTASFQLQATRVVVASGTTDIAVPFPGWELPGVITTTAALRLLHLDRVLPGRRVVVIGEGPFADELANDLSACGATVAGRLPSVDGVSAGGVESVRWVEAGGLRTECDALVLALGRQPDPQLAMQAQVAFEYSDRDGVFLATRHETLVTSLADVYLAGDAGGVGSPARAFAEGTVAGEAATNGAGLASALDRLRSMNVSPITPLRMPVIADATLVCRCEEVSAGTIRLSIADGAASMNDIKRRTRAGMGICQGAYCSRSVAGLLAATGTTWLEEIVPMTARPPARLISMAALAGDL